MRATRPWLGLLLAAAAAACGAPAPVPGTGAVGGTVAEIPSPAGPGSAQPALTAGGGTPVLSWIELAPDGRAAFRFAAWSAGGFAAPRTVVETASLVRDAADAPGVRRLADGSLLAHWGVKSPDHAQAYDLVVAASRDAGVTWSDPVRPHRDGVAVEHGFASVVPDAAGSGATVLWLDGRNTIAASATPAATGLYVARWDGAAFGPERVVDPRVCDCCRTAALAVPGGFLAAYRDRSDDEVRDISVVSGNTDSFSSPRDLRSDGWTINACPTNGPALAYGAPAGAIFASWFTAAGGAPAVWASLSRDGGKSFAPPVRLDAGAPIGRCDAAWGPDGAGVVWLEKSANGAELRARLVEPDGSLGDPVVVASTRGAKGVGVPRAVFAPDGRDLLVAWTDPGPPSRVRVASVVLPH